MVSKWHNAAKEQRAFNNKFTGCVLNLEQISLGQDGIKYVQSCLESAGKGLSKKLLELPLSSGTVHALVPEKTTLDRAKKFKVGGLTAQSDVLEWLAAHVLSLNAGSAHGMVLFQDAWGRRPTDASLKNAQSPMFFDSSDVYYAVKHDEITRDAVIQAAKDVRGFLSVGTFVDLPNMSKNIIGQTIDDNTLRRLAENVQEIFVSAYDGESIVVWRRPTNGFGSA